MRVTYDSEGDVLSLLLREGQIIRAEDHGLIIVNYGGDGEVVEIEVMKASEFLGNLTSTLMKAREKRIEVPCQDLSSAIVERRAS
jgi:uncharacterized protein YuzE